MHIATNHTQTIVALEVIHLLEAAIIVSINHVVIISVHRVNRQVEAIHLRAVATKVTHLHVHRAVVHHEVVIRHHVLQVRLAHHALQALAVHLDQAVAHHAHQEDTDVRHQ